MRSLPSGTVTLLFTDIEGSTRLLDALGDAYAARWASAAHGGQVLLSATTRPLAGDRPVESLGEHALKDFTTPREIFHAVIDGVGADAFPPPRTLDRARTNLPVPASPLVGRD